MFDTLSDNKLINAYEKAIELKLERDFIRLLEQELKNRNIQLINKDGEG